MTNPAIIEAAARALEEIQKHLNMMGGNELHRAIIRGHLQHVLAALPLIEAAALERAAKAMDRDDWSTWEEVVAAVTRALKEQP